LKLGTIICFHGDNSGCEWKSVQAQIADDLLANFMVIISGCQFDFQPAAFIHSNGELEFCPISYKPNGCKSMNFFNIRQQLDSAHR